MSGKLFYFISQPNMKRFVSVRSCLQNVSADMGFVISLYTHDALLDVRKSFILSWMLGNLFKLDLVSLHLGKSHYLKL